MADCTVTGCTRPASRSRGEMCDLHRQRRLRGKPLGAPVQDKLDPFARLVESAIAVRDCDSEDDPAFDRALDNLRKSACAWVRSVGREPTETEESSESVARRKVG